MASFPPAIPRRISGPGVIISFRSPGHRNLEQCEFRHHCWYEPNRLVVDGVVFAEWSVVNRCHTTAEIVQGNVRRPPTRAVDKMDISRTPSTEELEEGLE